jgi:RHS repeat-associated protein
LARSLFTSTNYETSPSRTDQQYVADLYNAYLQRGPDSSGLNWWAGQAAGGVTNRTNVCNAFEASGEFQTLVSTLYGAATSDNQRTESFVNDFYLGAYGRNATSTELQQQRDALNTAASQGQSNVQSQAETMGRSLFASQVTDMTISDGQYVTNLYEGFLQRGPDAGGLGFWTGQAAGGSANRQNILNAFATCSAFRALSASLYRETFWLVGDPLGTPRMVVDKTGSLTGIKRHDYLPFGEELYANTGGRTTTQGYNSASDNVRQKFTGYERDNESGLDFARSRYYSSQLGRFTSTDPLMASGRSAMPQSWNRYAYVLNNPLSLVDPTGLSEEGGTTIKHPDQIFYVERPTGIATIETKSLGEDPKNPGIQKYRVEFTVTENGTPRSDVKFQDTVIVPLGEAEGKITAPADAHPVIGVDNNNTEVSPEKHIVTLTVGEESKTIPVSTPIPYTATTYGNSVQVEAGYPNVVKLPDQIINVPVSGASQPQPSVVPEPKPQRPVVPEPPKQPQQP